MTAIPPKETQRPDSQGKPAIPAVIASPLGRDDGPGEIAASPPVEPDPSQDVAVQPVPEGGTPPEAIPPEAGPEGDVIPSSDPPQGESTLSDMAQAKANSYDFIMNHPQLRAAVEGVVSLQLGEVPDQTPQPAQPGQPGKATPPQGSEFVSREEYNQMKGTLDKITRSYADTKVAEMRAKHPNFQKLETQTGNIIRANPNLNLEQAYHLAEIAQNGGKLAVAQKTATLPPTESGPGGGGSRGGSDTDDPVARAQAAMKRLPPGQRQLEDSIRLAYGAALEKHGS